MMIERFLGTQDGSPVREKGFAGVFGAVMVGAVLWPVVENWRDQPKDSFPLSYYPMFSLKRAGATTVRYLVGLDARGGRHLLPHTLAGTGGLNQVRRQINKLVRGGKADTLCKLVAARVAQSDQERFAGIVTVQVIVGRYRLTDYFADKRGSVWERMDASRVREHVEASSPVERDLHALHGPPLRAVEDPA
ncbi:MAG: hypothetical protein ACRDTR_21680 [Rubrobacter sp.]